MKRIKIILFLVISLLMVLTFEVYAAGTELRLTGNAQVKAGNTDTAIVRIEGNDDKVGAITGKVTGNENISSIKMVGKNGWQVTYNETTGDFNALKAEGAITEEFAEITYTIKEGVSGKANITVGSLNLTTIEYKTITATSISKEISIKSGNGNVPTHTTTNTPESTPTPTPTTKPTNTPAGTVIKDKNEIANMAPTTLPKAGVSNFVIISIVAIAIISIFCHIRYKQYKKV